MCITTNARYPPISLLTIRLGNLRLHKESYSFSSWTPLFSAFVHLGMSSLPVCTLNDRLVFQRKTQSGRRTLCHDLLNWLFPPILNCAPLHSHQYPWGALSMNADFLQWPFPPCSKPDVMTLTHPWKANAAAEFWLGLLLPRPVFGNWIKCQLKELHS